MEICDEYLKQADQTLRQNWEKYRGHHVFVIGDKIFAAKNGEKAKELYRKLKEKYPGSPPLMTYIPKEGTLILWS